MNNFESIPRSHLLVSELLKNFARKTDELTRLRREIDALSDHIRSGEFQYDFAQHGPMPSTSHYADISTKRVALCVIGQSYKAKCQVVNDLFALKNKNVIGSLNLLERSKSVSLQRSTQQQRQRRSSLVTEDMFAPAAVDGAGDTEVSTEPIDDEICQLFNEDTGLAETGRMIRFQFARATPKEETHQLVGSIGVEHNLMPAKKRLNSLISPQLLQSNQMCLDVTFAHPLLSETCLLVSPTLPSLLDSQMVVEQLTEKSLPFFIYAIQHIPLSEQEERELFDLKRLLPEAAILFVKVDSDQTGDYSSLHGGENSSQCHHQKRTDSPTTSNRPRLGSSSVRNSCFTCSMENSHFYKWLQQAGLHGVGHWTKRANRCMFLDSSRRLHEMLVPFIRRQSRAYLLGGITGMQDYVNQLMQTMVGLGFEMSADSVTLPRRVEHLTEQVAKVRDSRLSMSQDRTAETFAMVVSKVKLDLMDDSSQLVRALNLIYFDSVDYNSLFDESLSNRAKRRILRIATDKIDTFIIEWVVKGVLAELDDIINPVDRGLLKRLVTRLQQHINVPWARFDQRSPAELAEEFLFMLPPVLSVGDGLTMTSSVLRRLAPDNYSLFFSFDYDWRLRHVSRVLCEVSPSLLARRLISQVREATASSFERFNNSFLILEQRLLNRVDNQMNRKCTMQQKLIPRTSRLLLEVTSYRDGILNRMPHFNTELGRGQFGVVYATDSDWHARPEGAKIAIKALVPANDRQWGDLAQEYFYMHYWMKHRHPNILQVLGVLIDRNYGPIEAPSTQVLLVLEQCSYDLYAGLKLRKHDRRNRTRLAHEIINGIRCLHSYGLCHRDIKLKNILIDANHTAKISDMGFCRPESLIDGSIVGTPIHMPSEIFDGHYTNKVDIYAYGILMWYVFAHTVRIPLNFERAPNKEQLWRMVARGVRPERVDAIDEQLWDMMSQCWTHVPEERPDAGSIAEFFERYCHDH